MRISLGVIAIALSIATMAAQQLKAVTYFISTGERGTAFRTTDRQLAAWALEAWARNSSGTLAFREAPEKDADIRVYWAQGDAGQYGEMRRTLVAGRPIAEVYVRPDTSFLGPDIDALAT